MAKNRNQMSFDDMLWGAEEEKQDPVSEPAEEPVSDGCLKVGDILSTRDKRVYWTVGLLEPERIQKTIGKLVALYVLKTVEENPHINHEFEFVVVRVIKVEGDCYYLEMPDRVVSKRVRKGNFETRHMKNGEIIRRWESRGTMYNCQLIHGEDYGEDMEDKLWK